MVNTLATHIKARGPELFRVACFDVEATVMLKRPLSLGREDCVLPGPPAFVLLPLPPGVSAAAGQNQWLVQSGSGNRSDSV